MIRHCVFLNYRADVTVDEKSRIVDSIKSLIPKINGMINVEHGYNVSSENLDKKHSDGFIVKFTNHNALVEYLENEEHKAVGQKIIASCEGGIEGVFVFDLVI